METTLTKLIETNSDCAQYTGTVTVATYLDERLLQKETHHNAGLLNLFKFISSCLQGNWSEAKSKKPSKLVLLKTAPNEVLTKGDPRQSTPSSEATNWGPNYAVCTPTMYTNAVVSKISTIDGKPASAVTYHFSIPFLKLISGANIKKLLLLPSDVSNYAQEACAYYILDNEIQIPEAAGNFTIVVEWTLTFTNAA